MRIIHGVFDSETRLKIVAAGAGVLGVIMLMAVLMVRVADDVGPPVRDVGGPVPESTSIGLLPPSPGTEPAPETRDYGRSDAIALEAVNAWLRGDLRTFASLATPETMEATAEAPRPPAGQRITGSVRSLLDGPTRQKVQVPTTDGLLDLDMIVIDGAWIVRNMEYHRE